MKKHTLIKEPGSEQVGYPNTWQTDFKLKLIKGDKEGPIILIKGTANHKSFTILKYAQQTLLHLYYFIKNNNTKISFDDDNNNYNNVLLDLKHRLKSIH